MNYNEFEEIVTLLYYCEISKKAYLEKIPNDISGIIYDNAYQEMTNMMVDSLMKSLFKDMYEDVCWFLYELSDTVKSCPDKDGPNIITGDGNKYWINNLETYLEYAKIELFDNGLKDTI